MLLREQEVAQSEGVRLASGKADDRPAERIVHHAVERIAQGIITAVTVADLEHCILPDLADNGAAGLFGLRRIAYEREHIVGQLIGYVESPAACSAPEPELNNAVIGADNIVLPAFILLVYLREVLEAPPAAVIVGI